MVRCSSEPVVASSAAETPSSFANEETGAIIGIGVGAVSLVLWIGWSQACKSERHREDPVRGRQKLWHRQTLGSLIGRDHPELGWGSVGVGNYGGASRVHGSKTDLLAAPWTFCRHSAARLRTHSRKCLPLPDDYLL